MTPRTRATVFGEVAEEYERIRPGYPARLVSDVLGRVPPGATALEVGAGTGKATVAFADRGLRVTAVEPDPAMAAVLRRRFAGHPHPAAVVPARFEDLRFEDLRVEDLRVEGPSFEGPSFEGPSFEDPRSGAGDRPNRFDLLFSGQAWHWTDPATRWRRAVTALVPGGTLALFWNDDRPVDDAIAAELFRVHRRIAPQALPPPRRSTHRQPPVRLVDAAALRDEWPAREMRREPGLADVTVRLYRSRRVLSRADYLALLSTHSGYRMLDEPTRRVLFAAVAGVVGDSLAQHVDTALFLARRA